MVPADPDDDFEQLSVPTSGQRLNDVAQGRDQLGTRQRPLPGAKANGISLKSRAIGYLSRREHSRAELQRKLQPYANVDDPEEIPRLLDELEKGNWLSNQRFAQSVVNRKAPAKGSALIMRELRQHGLADTELDSVKEQLQSTEFQRAQAVWARKFGARPVDAREYARQVRFLASRGFAPGVLRRILGELDDFST